MAYHFETEKHGALWYVYVYREGDSASTAPPVKEFHSQAEDDEGVTRQATEWINAHTKPRSNVVSRWGAWDMDTLESIGSLCPDCGGTGLDLLTDHGGSCPSCIGGRQRH